MDYGAPCLMSVAPAALQQLETAQNPALRVIVGAQRWAKCTCLRVEARACSVAARITQLSVGHLASLLRCSGSEQRWASVDQSLLQTPLLFRKRTWAAVATDKLKTNHYPRAFLAAPDTPHPGYSVTSPPSGASTPFTVTIKPLPVRKALLTGRRLAKDARNREDEVTQRHAAIYYTDGSVSHSTGAVGAAFVTARLTAHFRLPDGCSSTQAELVALRQALRHAVEEGGGPALIHCDSGAEFTYSLTTN